MDRGVPKKFLPAAAVSLVILVLVISGPAFAFTIVDWSADPGTTTRNNEIEILVRISQEVDEVLDTIQLEITDPNGDKFFATLDSCESVGFSDDGSGNVTGPGYGYGYLGYGSAFGYGYGYGYGYGSSFGTNDPMICKFTYFATTLGDHDGELFINGVPFGTEEDLFEIIPATQNGSSDNPPAGTSRGDQGGGGGGGGTPPGTDSDGGEEGAGGAPEIEPEEQEVTPEAIAGTGGPTGFFGLGDLDLGELMDSLTGLINLGGLDLSSSGLPWFFLILLILGLLYRYYTTRGN